MAVINSDAAKSEIAALVKPPGPQDDDRNIAGQVLAVHITLPILSLLFVALRLYTRAATKALGWDDALLIWGYILASVGDILLCVQTEYGLGWPMKDVEAWQLVVSNRMMYFVPPFNLTAGFFIKASLIYLYSRLAIEQWSRIACALLQILNSCYCLTFVMLPLFGCRPIAFFWDKSIKLVYPNARCLSYVLIFRTQGSLNISIDALILLVPAVIVWRSIILTTRKKLQPCALFALGCIAWIASILRITTFHSSARGNITKAAVATGLWGQVELHVGILAACASVVRKLLFGKTPRNSPTCSKDCKAAVAEIVERDCRKTSSESLSSWTLLRKVTARKEAMSR